MLTQGGVREREGERKIKVFREANVSGVPSESSGNKNIGSRLKHAAGLCHVRSDKRISNETGLIAFDYGGP
jgi:hypothetical protein